MEIAALVLALSDNVAACFISLVLGMALTPFSVQRDGGSLRSNSSSFFQLFFVLGMLGVQGKAGKFCLAHLLSLAYPAYKAYAVFRT